MNGIDGYIELSYEGKSISYVLNAMFDSSLEKLRMTSLSFTENYGDNDESYSAIWDNDEYLLTTLHGTVLLPWVEEKKIVNPDEFTALLKIEGVSIEDLEGIYDLMNSGIKLKFFEK